METVSYMVEGFFFILGFLCLVCLIIYVLVCIGASFTLVKVLMKNTYLYITNSDFRTAYLMSGDKLFFLKFDDEF